MFHRYIGLFFNLSENKTQTELRVHGSLHWMPLVRNLLDDRDQWVTVMVVGPFLKWREALAFFHLWTRQTRGKARRLRRGITLFNYYRSRGYDLYMWAQRTTLDALRAQIQSLRARHYTKALRKMGKAKRCHHVLRVHVETPPRVADAATTLARVRHIKMRRL